MQPLEQSAKTVDEAISLALRKLGVSRDQVEVLVLGEGRSGLFGIGAEEARVRVTVLPPAAPAPAAPLESGTAAPREQLAAPPTADELETAQTVLAELLPLMGIEADVVVRPPSEDSPETGPVLDVTGEDLGILIGRRGETLSALQFIVNLITSRRLERQIRIPIDVESYRSRREASLRSLATRLAERVAETHQAITMEEMPPAERRIVHLALATHPDVMTKSTGEGDRRKVVILPRR